MVIQAEQKRWPRSFIMIEAHSLKAPTCIRRCDMRDKRTSRVLHQPHHGHFHRFILFSAFWSGRDKHASCTATAIAANQSFSRCLSEVFSYHGRFERISASSTRVIRICANFDHHNLLSDKSVHQYVTYLLASIILSGPHSTRVCVCIDGEF